MIFQLPLPRDSIVLDYSRWQQNLIGVLQFDIEYHEESEMGKFNLYPKVIKWYI